MHVSSPAQRAGWAKEYMTDPAFHELFFKTADPSGNGEGYRPIVVDMWRRQTKRQRDGGVVDTVLFQQKLPYHVVTDYGGASELWQEWTFSRLSCH